MIGDAGNPDLDAVPELAPVGEADGGESALKADDAVQFPDRIETGGCHVGESAAPPIAAALADDIEWLRKISRIAVPADQRQIWIGYRLAEGDRLETSCAQRDDVGRWRRIIHAAAGVWSRIILDRTSTRLNSSH